MRLLSRISRVVPAIVVGLALNSACGVQREGQSNPLPYRDPTAANPNNPPVEPVATGPVPSAPTGPAPRPGGFAVDCANPAKSTNDCDVEPGSDWQLVHADFAGPDGPVYGGYILSAPDGVIACSGCDCDKHPEAAAATQINCARAFVTPGLINGHDHITWASGEPASDSGERYDHRNQWRKGINHTQIPQPNSSNKWESVSLGEIRFIMGGATAIVGSGSANKLARNFDSNTNGRLEQGLTDRLPVQYDTFPLNDNNATTLAENGCGTFTIEAPKANGGVWYPHVSEGVNEAAANEFDCLSSTSEGGQDLMSANATLIHAVGLSTTDIALLAARQTSVVWSPRTNISLYGYTASVTTMARLGVNIALGTDWLLSGSMNMLREFRCVDSLNRNQYGYAFSDKAILDMATINAAKAAGFGDKLGKLVPGYMADLSFFAMSPERDLYRAVMEAEAKDVLLVQRAGLALYGDASIMKGLGHSEEDCEALDVCTSPKQMCAKRETGKTLAELSAAFAHKYKLFECGEPPREPTCRPMRAERTDTIRFDGSSTDSDVDGDGVADKLDSCPTIFNPARPMDFSNGSLLQEDFDGDGEGDACDVCPIDADRLDCPEAKWTGDR